MKHSLSSDIKFVFGIASIILDWSLFVKIPTIILMSPFLLLFAFLLWVFDVVRY